MSDTSPMMQQYEGIKKQHNDAILFFRLGDFYEMFKQDAFEANRILGLTLTQRQGVPMCGIPFHASKTYIAKLLANGKKIAICDQVAPSPQSKGIAERHVVQIITPGTLVDGDYLDSGASNYLLSISRPNDGCYAWALAELSTGEVKLKVSSQDLAVDDFLTFLAKYAPRELLVQESIVHQSTDLARELKNLDGLVLNRFGDWLYDVEETQKKMQALMGLVSLKGFGIQEGSLQVHAMSAILHYGEDTARHRLEQLRNISIIDDATMLKLDETSVKNLELLCNLQDGGTAFSLLAQMHHTKTPMGMRYLRQTIVEPLLSKSLIDRRLQKVSFLYHQQDFLTELRVLLSRVQDIERIANRIILDRAHAKELRALAASIDAMIEIEDKIRQTDLASSEDHQETLTLCAQTADLIRKGILDEPAVVVHEGGLIRHGFDEKVDYYRSLQSDSESILEAYVEEERKLTGLTALKLKYNRIIGYYFELSKSHIGVKPEHFIRKQSLVNGERFATTRLRELEDNILSAKELCIEREREIFLQLRDTIKSSIKSLLVMVGSIAELDLIACFAVTATQRGYSCPVIYEDQRLHILQGRHPVVEQHVGLGKYIPNDCSLSLAASPEKVALLTGPNMAGKSTFLRQTALIVLMAQMGSWVPAEYAEIGLTDRIFCRVGASDNLAKGESTFLVEMNETAMILRHASEKSLIIMDEVGRGTGTQDGLAIARSILEYLVSVIQARCLFATHFHELTECGVSGFRNLSMSVQESDGKVYFLKKVVDGPSSNSYGVHVAQLAGLPDSVIRRARLLVEISLAKLETRPQTTLPPVVQENNAVQENNQDQQASLFDDSEELRLSLLSFNTANKTPLEALNFLDQVKKRFGLEQTIKKSRS